MASRSWILLDAHEGICVDELQLGAEVLSGAAGGVSASVKRLRGGKREGVHLIEIDNGTLKFAVVPERGMGLWRAWLGELEIGWQSPVRGPVHPQWVNLADSSGLGWLDGFDELLCRCGLQSNGAPVFDEKGTLLYPLHGQIANLPAHRVELRVDDETGEVKLIGVVDETRFHFQKLRLTAEYSIQTGSRELHITDTVTNLSASLAEIELLYHINFGQPLLDPGSRLVAPVKSIVPRNARAASGIQRWDAYGNEEPGFEEQVYFFDVLAMEDGRTQVLLRNAHGNAGVSLGFNKRQLPHFTQWKNTTAAQDGYVTGLEPGVNFPNPLPFEKEQGRVTAIAGGGSKRFDLSLTVHSSAEEVSVAERAVRALQGDVAPQVFDAPQPGWTTG